MFPSQHHPDENFIDIEQVCHHLGLDWPHQKAALHSSRLGHHLRQLTLSLPHPSGQMAVKCCWVLPEPHYYRWLSRLNPDHIKPTLRQSLIRYQHIVQYRS